MHLFCFFRSAPRADRVERIAVESTSSSDTKTGAVSDWKALSVIEKREAEPFDGAFLPDYLTRIRCFDPLILP